MKFALKLLLAKLLLPEAFGLIGMCMIFIGITQAIAQLGMNAALIQKKEDHEAEILYNTAFWTNLCFSVVLYFLLSFVLAPIVANFYDEKVLKTILPFLSLPILIQPFSLIPSTILTRKLDFKSLAKAFNIATLIAGVIAVAMAYFDFGVWALVVNQVLAIGLALPTLIYFTRWMPKLEWKKAYFDEIFSFGMFSTGTSLTRSIMGNVDKLIIGKFMGKDLLGAYTLAITLTDHLASFLVRITNKVIYPVFSNHQDDKAKLKLFFLTIMKVNALMVYPVMAFLVYFAEDVIIEFFGDQWSETVTPLRIIAIAMVINVLSNGFDAMLRAKGKPKLEFKLIALVNLFVLVPLLYFGAKYFGIIGASMALPINSIILVGTATIVLNKEINLGFSEPFKAIKSPLVAAMLASILCYGLQYTIPNFNHYILMVIFISIYALSALFFERAFFKKIIANFFVKPSL
ncbi:lipopolysaccharide biosynthesis protein [Muricauda sp. DJ-13]|uniref:Lipopolysaccharide biosynthesis protein n=2 Tax=Croceivirga thetidis TaxID=2721623 RepID=A0ABX1GSN8_9FLAO|nr:lipopolysaccharide biosynthesis protein [Croceivirga thetidis]NKI32020.1 lipopolysaccharide biosynthesis protein [Croceivirga thetidis]